MRRAALIIAFVLGFAVLCDAQESGPSCDFSSYKPQVPPNFHYGIGAKRVEPQYPRIAREARVEGIVRVVVIVDEKGAVADACAHDGPLLLRVAARRAALRWKFEPTTIVSRDGKPMRVYLRTEIKFNFRLD